MKQFEGMLGPRAWYAQVPNTNANVTATASTPAIVTRRMLNLTVWSWPTRRRAVPAGDLAAEGEIRTLEWIAWYQERLKAQPDMSPDERRQLFVTLLDPTFSGST